MKGRNRYYLKGRSQELGFLPKPLCAAGAIVLLLQLSFLYGLQAQAPGLATYHYSIDDGLSNRNVQCLHQDEQGFLWIGTKNGLNRFDGYEFKWYNREQQGLQSNEINHMLEGPRGQLWLIHTGFFFRRRARSIDLFDPVIEKALSFEDYFGNEAPFTADQILCFGQHPSGSLAFLVEGGKLFTYDGHEFQQMNLELGAFRSAERLHWTENGYFWLSLRMPHKKKEDSDYKLLCFDAAGRTAAQFYFPSPGYLLPYQSTADGGVQLLAFDHERQRSSLLACSPSGAKKELPAGRRLMAQLGLEKQKPNPLWHFIRREGAFWLDVGNSIWMVPDKTAANEGLPAKMIDIADLTDLHFSDNGQIWAGTLFGVYAIRRNRHYFRQILHRSPGAEAAMRSLTFDKKGALWMAEEAQPHLWRLPAGAREPQPFNFLPPDEYQLPFPSSYCYALITTRSGKVCYSLENLIIWYDPSTRHYEVAEIDKPDRSWGVVWALQEDEEGKMWFATDRGGIGYLEDGQTRWLPPLEGTQHTYQFMRDSGGATWLATDGGIFRLDTKENKIVERYSPDGTGRYHFPFSPVYHIYEEASGAFWVSTGGQGLVYWKRGQPLGEDLKAREGEADSKDTIRYRQYTRTEGLSNNTIYAAYEDDNGNLWMPSDYGIMQFDKKTKRTSTFLEEDGITHYEFNRLSHCRGPDGSLYFGSLNGVNAFHPKDFSERLQLADPPLVVTEFQQYDSEGKQVEGSTQRLLQDAVMIIRPRDRFFRIEFALLTFHEADKNCYAYKVEGVDKDWHYQRENSVRFSRLPYGEHLLRIRGQSADGQWSSKELLLQVNVLRPVYLKWWFLGLLALLLAAVVITLIRWRVLAYRRHAKRLRKTVMEKTATIRQQAEELKLLDHMKSRFFINVSHELRTPLTLMLGPISSVLKSPDLPKGHRRMLRKAQESGQQLMRLVGSILDLSRLEAGKLPLKYSDTVVLAFLEQALSSFEFYAQQRSIELALDYRAAEGLYLRLDKAKAEIILNNLLSNALKYVSKGGKVTLRAAAEDGHLLIEVEDNGRGIHPEDLPQVFNRFFQSRRKDAPLEGGSGIGLALSKELAQLMGGDLTVKSQLGQGSVFKLVLPLVAAEAPTPPSEVPVAAVAETKEARLAKAAKSGLALAKVLIVEDHHGLRGYLKQILQARFELLEAENGQEALEILGQHKDCKLVITDIMMPVMDGYELLERLKVEEQYREIPVIVLTAREKEEDQLKAMRLGVDDYLLKPFEEEELLARIHQLLENFQQRRAQRERETHHWDDGKKTSSSTQTEAEEEWLREIERLALSMLDDERLSVNWLAAQTYVSERQVQRRLKKMTGLTPSRFLRELRLQKARRMLETGQIKSVKEVASTVGFKAEKHFSRIFRERFGKYPSQYL